jgi:hypothetical protein
LIRYQDSSEAEQSGCFLANSSKRFRVMMCIGGYYLIMRYLSIKKYNRQHNRRFLQSEASRKNVRINAFVKRRPPDILIY